MQILCIGNSFSRDALRYLHQIARADGVEICAVNLYIGGCPLNLHYRNMLSEEKAYILDVNGTDTGFKVSLKEALLSREWDYISFQQVSILSGNFDTYEPYLSLLSQYVKKYAPKAKQIIHQTWAYEEGSERLMTLMGYKQHRDMHNELKKAYNMAVKSINADMLIPAGDVFLKLTEKGVSHIFRDTQHASLGIGRYALGLIWYRFLTKKDIAENTFIDFDETISQGDIKTIKECVMSVKL